MGRKALPPIIGRTCTFDAKIYKNVGGIFLVSLYPIRKKKFLDFFIFVSDYLRESFENPDKNLREFTADKR